MWRFPFTSYREKMILQHHMEACEAYFNELQASYKELIPLSECAHNPVVEKTDDVSDILISISDR